MQTINSNDRQTHVSDVTVFARTVSQKGLRTRFFSESEIQSKIEAVRKSAVNNQAWSYDAWHAGSVANAYNYPAATTGLLMCSNPDGQVVVWMCRLSANKVTLSGVCRHTVAAAAPLFDDRYSSGKRVQAELDLQTAHAEAICTRWSCMDRCNDCGRMTQSCEC